MWRVFDVGGSSTTRLAMVYPDRANRIVCKCYPRSRISTVEVRRSRSTSCAGFTLLELLVVMVIIGLLASYVAPRFFDQIGKSEIKATRAQLDAFDKALATYCLDVGHYPGIVCITLAVATKKT